MKLWSKQYTATSANAKMVEQFTTGNDRIFDMQLAPFDVLTNIAHATMLATIDLLSNNEVTALKKN